MAADGQDIDSFFNSFLEKWVLANPEMATNMRLFSGDVQNRLDSQLSDISDEAAHARIARAKEGLAELKKFDRAKLTPEQKFSAEMMEYQLKDIVAEEPFLNYSFPLNQFGGVQVRLPSLMTDIHPMKTQRDAENYLARLSAAGGKINQAMGIMQDRARQGVRLPGFISVETVAQMKRFTEPDPATNILVSSFAERLSKIGTIDASKKAAMTASAEKIVRDSIYPAYRGAMDGLATVNAKATDDAGLWRLPHGAVQEDRVSGWPDHGSVREAAGGLQLSGYAKCAGSNTGGLREDSEGEQRAVAGGVRQEAEGELHCAEDSRVPGGECGGELFGSAEGWVAAGDCAHPAGGAEVPEARDADARRARGDTGAPLPDCVAGGNDFAAGVPQAESLRIDVGVHGGLGVVCGAAGVGAGLV